jgi:hypothetical protein
MIYEEWINDVTNDLEKFNGRFEPMEVIDKIDFDSQKFNIVQNVTYSEKLLLFP